jgi:predicted aspartyl protease
MKKPGYSQEFEKPISPWLKSKGFWFIAAVMVVLHLAAAALYLFASGKYQYRFRTSKPMTVSEVSGAVDPSIPDRDVPSSRIPFAPSGTNKHKIYTWRDEKGVRHFSNKSPENTQQDIRVSDANAHVDLGLSESIAGKLQSAYSTSRRTRVLIEENRILVPVRLGYRNREVQTLLLLDTGATQTTVYRSVAHRLNFWETRPSSARVADGRTVASDTGILDYIVVGPHKLSNFDVSVIDFHGNVELPQGLLGMNFLRTVRYDIDYGNQTINWR